MAPLFSDHAACLEELGPSAIRPVGLASRHQSEAIRPSMSTRSTIRLALCCGHAAPQAPQVAESSDRAQLLDTFLFSLELRHPAADLTDSWHVPLSGSSQR